MDNTGYRVLTNQLAEDLGWLEEHSRKNPQQALAAVQLRLAAALVRNCVGPYLDKQTPTPLHIAVVGGAGTGKSTVSNMLTGAAAAEANPQAGYTRHPIAYTNSNGAVTWAGHLGFLGKLQRLERPSPSNVDADVYQVRAVPPVQGVVSVLNNFVVWDCPDMTTWAATGYVPRLLEVAGLADLIVYVASDERYNDEVPTQFLNLFLQAGKPVVCCLTKMRETDAPAFVAHFQKEVVSKLPSGVVGCIAIPHLPAPQLADPARLAGKYRVPLLNQISVLGQNPLETRRKSVRWAVNHLIAAHEKLMNVARQDIAVMQDWKALVDRGREEFDSRYHREYLTSEKFRRFDEALVRLLELLELPGVGKPLSNALWVLRTPYRLLKGFLSKSLSRPEPPAMPEQPVLEAALAGWLDLLHKEAAQRGNTHPLWMHIEKGFSSGRLGQQAKERFQLGVRGFQIGLADEVERTARAIYEDLEKSPVVLNTLRGGKFAIDIAAVLTGVVMVGHNYALDLVVVPVAASITHQLVELLGSQYVETQRNLARDRQQALEQQHISSPLDEYLVQWPATGGSAFERLQTALQRIPQAVRQVEAAVTQSMK
jgi:hypothetical protein